MSPLFFAGNVASIVGLFVAVFTLKWVARVLNALGLTNINVNTSPDGASRAAGLAALLLHPAPWLLLGGAIYLAHWATSEQDPAKRVVVVLWSVGTYLAVCGFAIWALVRQSQRRRALEAKK